MTGDPAGEASDWPPVAALGVALLGTVALTLGVAGVALGRALAALDGGPATLAAVPAGRAVEAVAGGVYLLVAVGVVGHLVRERSGHVPDPGDPLFGAPAESDPEDDP